jgi:hypothetical protein
MMTSRSSHPLGADLEDYVSNEPLLLDRPERPFALPRIEEANRAARAADELRDLVAEQARGGPVGVDDHPFGGADEDAEGTAAEQDLEAAERFLGALDFGDVDRDAEQMLGDAVTIVERDLLAVKPALAF